MSASPSILPPTHEEPMVRIRPTSRWKAINFKEIWEFRDLILILAGRDVKLRYRQTALGVIWVVMQPLLGAGIFSFLSAAIAKTPTDGPRYPFVFTGMLAWTAVSTTLTKVSICMVQNAHLVTKIYFPRLILPLSTVLSALLDFAVGFVMLAILMFAWDIHFGPQIILMPICLALLLALSLGIGLITAGLTVQYRDVQFVLPVFLQFLMFITPVWFNRAAVPEKYQWVYTINPFSGLLDVFRWSIIPGAALHWGAVLYSVIFAVVTLIIGAYSFRSMERRFADVI
jgi:lipopolysaccharide transport system permease protein